MHDELCVVKNFHKTLAVFAASESKEFILALKTNLYIIFLLLLTERVAAVGCLFRVFSVSAEINLNIFFRQTGKREKTSENLVPLLFPVYTNKTSRRVIPLQ